MDQQISDSAARGAAWLDKHCPKWWEHIDILELKMNNSSVCILGQLGKQGITPSFGGMELLAGKGSVTEFGFATPTYPADRGFNSPGHWTQLDGAWKREITNRMETYDAKRTE